jgi:hypothetical protein
MARTMGSLIPHQHINDHLTNPDRVAAVEWARDLLVSRAEKERCLCWEAG